MDLLIEVRIITGWFGRLAFKIEVAEIGEVSKIALVFLGAFIIVGSIISGKVLVLSFRIGGIVVFVIIKLKD